MVIEKPLTEVSEQEYDTMFAVNAKAAFFVMREAATRMSNGGKSRVKHAADHSTRFPPHLKENRAKPRPGAA